MYFKNTMLDSWTSVKNLSRSEKHRLCGIVWRCLEISLLLWQECYSTEQCRLMLQIFLRLNGPSCRQVPSCLQNVVLVYFGLHWHSVHYALCLFILKIGDSGKTQALNTPNELRTISWIFFDLLCPSWPLKPAVLLLFLGSWITVVVVCCGAG